MKNAQDIDSRLIGDEVGDAIVAKNNLANLTVGDQFVSLPQSRMVSEQSHFRFYAVDDGIGSGWTVDRNLLVNFA